MADDNTTTKAPAARVQIIHEARLPKGPSGWQLCLQWGRYFYTDGDVQEGYRFIWRRPNGNLQAARGQARILSRAMADQLFTQAEEAGWGHLTAADAG